jgi:hypothetical protein
MLNELENYIRNNSKKFDSELPSSNVWQAIENGMGTDINAKQKTAVENLIIDNRNAFDAATPSAKVWENIAAMVEPKKQAKVFTIKDLYKWSAAAAILCIALTSAYFLLFKKQAEDPATVNVETPIVQPKLVEIIPLKKDTIEEELGAIPTKDMAYEDKVQSTKVPDVRDRVDVKTTDNTGSNDMFKIIATKQAELKALTKDKPYLYQEFTADLLALESSYGTLKKQLNKTPNTDVIITAMMQNLQLQAELLGRQLTIINNIKKHKQNDKNINLND